MFYYLSALRLKRPNSLPNMNESIDGLRQQFSNSERN
jgi:hypothetical protein